VFVEDYLDMSNEGCLVLASAFVVLYTRLVENRILYRIVSNVFKSCVKCERHVNMSQFLLIDVWHDSREVIY